MYSKLPSQLGFFRMAGAGSLVWILISRYKSQVCRNEICLKIS